MTLNQLTFWALILLLPTWCLGAETGPKPLNLYIGIGPTIPNGPEEFRSDHKTGFHVLTGLGYALNPNAEVIGRLEFHVVSVDFEERFGANVDFSGGGVDFLVVGADIKLSTSPPATPVRPFVIGGGGWSRMAQSNISTELAFEQYAPLLIESQTRFYFNLGLGLEITPVKTLTTFLLLRYVELRQDGENLGFIPISFGIRF